MSLIIIVLCILLLFGLIGYVCLQLIRKTEWFHLDLYWSGFLGFFTVILVGIIMSGLNINLPGPSAIIIAVFVGSFMGTFFSKKNTPLIGLIIGIIFATALCGLNLKDGTFKLEYTYEVAILTIFASSLISAGISGYLTYKLRKSNKLLKTN